jgi:hypothetical protein
MFRQSDADNQSMRHDLLARIFRKPAAPTTLRMSVCPPEVCPQRGSLWNATLRWLVGGAVKPVPSLRTPLERARCEFVEAMEGLVDLDTGDLLRRAQHARSLRELWHLRSELYTTIARRLSQPEADARLARVNQHFPTRAQRVNPLAPEAADVH